MKKIILLLASISLTPIFNTFAADADEQFSLSPSTQAKTDELKKKHVKWQTGCALPDLSNSAAGGEATLNVFINSDGSTHSVEIENSSGTPEENAEIIKTFKNCYFVNIKAINFEFPEYFYKTLKYKWNAGNGKPLVGLSRCMRAIEYPIAASMRGIQGLITWGVTPNTKGGFDKKLIDDSKTKILGSYTERQLDKCLENPDIAESIRKHFKPGEWDTFTLNFELKKQGI